jgi:4'-phosphopantetheinyl transferase
MAKSSTIPTTPDPPETDWLRMAAVPALGIAEVHIWRADLDAAGEMARLEAVISEDERERAARFRMPEHGRRFAAARGILRLLLGEYLRVPAGEIRFGENAHGKPFVAFPANTDLRFNVSHSGAAALLAFARGREVGVDVEQVRLLPMHERLAERFFTPAEAARLRALPEERRLAAFFDCWVRKEAVVKAVGRGVSFGLDRFEVAFASGPVSVRCPDDPTDWLLLPLELGGGATGALVVAGAGWTPRYWQWPLAERADPC